MKRSTEQSASVCEAILGRRRLLSRPRLGQALAFLLLLTLPEFGWSFPSAAQQQQGLPLGSLNTAGEVFVGDSPVSSDVTIFAKDSVRTGNSGGGIFTASGKGSFKISPDSQLVFSDDPKYVAELKAGTVAFNSSGGPSGMVVRTANFVVLPALRDQPSSATITRNTDGSFVISCLGGSVGVVPLQGTNGLFMQVGQSVRISSTGILTALESRPAPGSAGPRTQTHAGRSPSQWVVIALVGGAAAAAGAVIATHTGNNGTPVSPSVP